MISTFTRITAESIVKQTIPIIGVGCEIYQQYQKEKFKFFLDEVEKGTKDIKIGDLNEYDILHTAYLTQQVLLKIRQKEKIKLLADLFISYCTELSPDLNEILNDKYELYLRLIEDLSLQDFRLLNILYLYQKEVPDFFAGENKLILMERYWDSFIKQSTDELGVTQEYIEALLAKVNGTGLYITITGMYLGYTGNEGYLTPIFYELVQFLGKEYYEK